MFLVLGGGLQAQFYRKTRCSSLRLGGGLEAQFVANHCVFGAWVGAWRHILTLFTVIPPLWLISGQAWEAHFDATGSIRCLECLEGVFWRTGARLQRRSQTNMPGSRALLDICCLDCL